LKDLEIWEKIKFVKVNYQTITPDINLRLDSIPALISELKRLFPEDSQGIETFFKHLYGIIEDFEKITPAFMDVAFPLKKWKKILFYLKLPIRHFRFLAKMMKFRKTTVKNMVDKCITNEKLRFLLSSRSSLIEEALSWRYILLDNWWPIGGMQELVNRFAETIEKDGGELSLGTKVEKIIVKNGKAVGVSLEDGREIYSDFVVSNVDYKQTFTKLVDSKHLKKDFVEKVKRTKVSGSVFSVYLGVGLSQKELENVRAQHVICRLAYEKKDINNPEFYKYCPEFWICIPSLADESLAPKGKSVIILQAPASYNYMNKWQTDNGKRTKAYRELKRKVADELIATAEKIIPDLSKLIVVRDEATPLTMERYTLNTDGAITGWGEAFYKGFFGGSIRTPIRNLFTVGHWSFSMGGISIAMLSGKKAAETILEKA
jgi:phytoene dehydrogenase-like protein